MSCYEPLVGYRSKYLNHLGNRPIVFNVQQGYVDRKVTVPCGQCIGCRLDKAKEWALRCKHEAKDHAQNCFVTLTYNDNSLPFGGNLAHHHVQSFMKRLRKAVEPKKIKMFMCGEYGEKLGRPHYHLILFNHDFKDKKLWKTNNGNPLYISDQLEGLWRLGFCSVGAVTFQSAGYVARYALKKVTGPQADSHYRREIIIPETGEIRTIHLEREYVQCSNGVGREWLKKYKGDAYRDDFVVLDGVKHRLPSYYDRKFGEDHDNILKTLKARRRRRAVAHSDDQTPERRKVRKTVQEARINRLRRDI